MAALHRVGMTGDQIMEILRDAREAASLAVESRVAAELAAEKAQRAADNAGKEAAEAKKAADIAVKHVIEVRKQILLLAAEEYEERDGARQIGKKRKPEQGSEPEQTVSPDADAPAVKPSSPVEPSPKGPPIPMGPPPMGPAMGPPMGPPQEGSPVDWPPRDRWDPIGDMLEFKRLQRLSGKSVPGPHQSRSESVHRRMN